MIGYWHDIAVHSYRTAGVMSTVVSHSTQHKAESRSVDDRYWSHSDTD